MKVPFSYALGISLVSLLAGCSSSRNAERPAAVGTAVARWQSRPLTIDGSDRDWDKPLPFGIREEKVNYSITNDQQNLYVLLSTADPQEQQKIIQGGMSVWINTNGEKSNGDAVGVGYPLDEHNDPERKLMEEAQPQRYQNKKPVTLEQKKTYALYGFSKDSSIQNYAYGGDNPAGIVMRLDYNNNGEMIYEASIPLQALYPDHDPSTPYPSHDMAIGIFIEGLPPNTRVRREGGGESPIGLGLGAGAGTGGWGSGVGLGLGLSHEFGGGGRRAKRTLFDQAQIWQVVRLARK